MVTNPIIVRHAYLKKHTKFTYLRSLLDILIELRCNRSASVINPGLNPKGHFVTHGFIPF